MAKKKEWNMSDVTTDRIVAALKAGKGDLIPAGILAKAIQNILKRNGGGEVMKQSFQEVQTDLNLRPRELAALMRGHTVEVRRSRPFIDNQNIVIQKATVHRKTRRQGR